MYEKFISPTVIPLSYHISHGGPSHNLANIIRVIDPGQKIGWTQTYAQTQRYVPLQTAGQDALEL